MSDYEQPVGSVPLKFLSQEWSAGIQEAINSNARYREAAREWEGDLVFIVLPDHESEAVGVNEPIQIYLDLWHGECREVSVLEHVDEKRPLFTITGTFFRFMQVFNNDLDAMKGLVQGTFKLKGDMRKIMRYAVAAKALVTCLQTVRTEFD